MYRVSSVLSKNKRKRSQMRPPKQTPRTRYVPVVVGIGEKEDRVCLLLKIHLLNLVDCRAHFLAGGSQLAHCLHARHQSAQEL
jgi:hypothetical protein